VSAEELIAFIDARLDKPGWCAGLAVSLGYAPNEKRVGYFPENVEDYFRLLERRYLRRIRDLATDLGAQFRLSVQEFYMLEFRIVAMLCAASRLDPRPGHINFPDWFTPTARRDTQAVSFSHTQEGQSK
jgi:hypothetical protein